MGVGAGSLPGEGSKWMCGLRVWHYMLLASLHNSLQQFIQAWFYTVYDEISWSHPNSVPSSVLVPPRGLSSTCSTQVVQ